MLPTAFVLALALTSQAKADDKPASPALEAFVTPGATVKPCDSDSPLAEGWPRGTEPGRVEVKDYPAYRSAVARGKEGSLGADSMLFFPLFRHISQSEIAMTTPVVSNYEPKVVEKPRATGDVSMEFVYRTPTIGKTGQGLGMVQVEDHPASKYACLGVQGPMTPDKMRKGVEALKGWLADHKGEWVEDGPARRLGYHGPMTRENERLWEIQIPVKPAAKPEKPTKKGGAPAPDAPRP